MRRVNSRCGGVLNAKEVLTLSSQWRHVLVRAAVDLVTVRVDSQHQHHDASHNTSRHRPDWGTLDHVERRHLFVCTGEKNKSPEGPGEGVKYTVCVCKFSRLVLEYTLSAL